jgi:hypothetical protein
MANASATLNQSLFLNAINDGDAISIRLRSTRRIKAARLGNVLTMAARASKKTMMLINAIMGQLDGGDDALRVSSDVKWTSYVLWEDRGKRR